MVGKDLIGNAKPIQFFSQHNQFYFKHVMILVKKSCKN